MGKILKHQHFYEYVSHFHDYTDTRKNILLSSFHFCQKKARHTHLPTARIPVLVLIIGPMVEPQPQSFLQAITEEMFDHFVCEKNYMVKNNARVVVF